MLIIIGTNTVVTEMGNSNFRISGYSHYFTKLSGNFHGKKNDCIYNGWYTSINPSHSDLGRGEKINLKFLFSHLSPKGLHKTF